ncbi:HAD domain-containing protein [Pelomonas sp. SE-A7]|uniref:HAD domain-containing protein n=1 Tax=Pelomonas sp. SE-A7 TaxID=3054953 RepID=UPI00259C7AE2|nr:HAD domain-containing protein [Pelomonas sp. SE-A7]MDM4768309.1 HAD domain-containing protein [Pelomonas sp. SE-A7]
MLVSLMILYLDFDGPLHPDAVYITASGQVELRAPGHRLFESMHLLEAVLEPHPSVRVVLSTSWVFMKSFSFARRQLSPSFQSRVVGATFHSREDRDSFSRMTRWQQIARDVARRRPHTWIALDDDDFEWPDEQRHHLVKADEWLGLQDANCRLRLAEALASGSSAVKASGEGAPSDGGLQLLKDVQRKDAEDVAAGRRQARSLWVVQPGDLEGYTFTSNPNSEFDKPGNGW